MGSLPPRSKQDVPPLLEWGPSLSVGVKRIDDQHRHLVAVINDLHEAVGVGKGDAIYDALFQELVNYFTAHFEVEEDLMLAHDYSEAEKHRLVHGGFIAKVRELREKANRGDKHVSEEALTYLKEWLLNHDVNVDMKLGAFLNARGIR